jgi:hypothetical protein
MSKRSADRDLNQNNVDEYDNEDNMEETQGPFKAANPETLKQRVIVKARRRMGGDDSTPAPAATGAAPPAAAATVSLQPHNHQVRCALLHRLSHVRSRLPSLLLACAVRLPCI